MSTVDGVAVSGPMGEIREARGDALAAGRWDDARSLFTEMVLADDHPDFLTVPAHER